MFIRTSLPESSFIQSNFFISVQLNNAKVKKEEVKKSKEKEFVH